MKIYFISGTDTGVGKTLVSALFCRSLMQQGNSTAYVKPVQTGDVSDAAFVQKVCGPELKSYTARHYSLPASPHLSASLEGKRVVLDEVVKDVLDFADSVLPDVLVVEGAGGISVPLNDQDDMADLCRSLGAELVIVTRAGLGTLNHTYLTLHYAFSQGFKPSVIISGCQTEPDIIEKDNIKMIRQMADGNLMGRVPFVKGINTENCQAANLPQVDFRF